MAQLQNNIHAPVLLNELLTNLKVKSDGSYIDCTAGFGGHSGKIADLLSSGSLICIDQDINAINHLNKLFKGNDQISIIHNNFVNLDRFIKQNVDGIIMDLGVSSLMFDDPTRGFSYRLDGPLDMRMDVNNKITAATIINEYSRSQLIDLFKKYADVRSPNKVVDAIISKRKKRPIKSTTELAEIIAKATPGSLLRKHPAKVYFQALRIEVNKELDVLSKAMQKACSLLKHQGRLCIITFHSLEDRLVKAFFKELTEIKDLYGKDVPIRKMSKPLFKLITKKPILPTLEEIRKNRRSHSAKLRVIEKI